MAQRLLARWKSDADWRTWNWSRSRARRLVRERAEELRGVPCAPSKKEVP